MVLVPPSPLRRQAETSAALIVRAWMWPGAVGPSCGMACEDWQTLPSDSHSDDLSLSEMMRAKGRGLRFLSWWSRGRGKSFETDRPPGQSAAG